MPAKNTSVISARVKDETALKLGELAQEKGITIAKFIDDLVEAYDEKGVTPDGYAVSEDLDTPFGMKVDQRFEKLRERGYPERIIEMMKDQILAGLDSQIELLPKKYDPRRMRDDCGC